MRPLISGMRRFFSSIDQAQIVKTVHKSEKEKNHWKGTLGIVGDPLNVARLSKLFVRECNDRGLFLDQEIPEFISVGILPEVSGHMRDLVKVADDFGCDAIVTNFSKKELKGSTKLPIYVTDGGRGEPEKEILKKVSDYILAITKPRRSHGLLCDPSNPDKITKNLNYDEVRRDSRIDQRKKHIFYPALKMSEFVGIVHGAGPASGAAAMEYLAEKGIPYVAWGVNSAPGKNDFELGEGPSYIPHYENAVRFFEKIGASRLIVPCNTAHARLEEFCANSSDKVIDIRRATLTAHRSSEGFILLGTNRTTGVGLPSEKKGLYEEIRFAEFPEQGPFILPNEQQQKLVMEAIYDVKAGRNEDAKNKTTAVVREIRKNQLFRPFKVILGCTELPLPFSKRELADQAMIDPTDAVTTQCKKELDELRIARLMKDRQMSGGPSPDVTGQTALKVSNQNDLTNGIIH